MQRSPQAAGMHKKSLLCNMPWPLHGEQQPSPLGAHLDRVPAECARLRIGMTRGLKPGTRLTGDVRSERFPWAGRVIGLLSPGEAAEAECQSAPEQSHLATRNGAAAGFIAALGADRVLAVDPGAVPDIRATITGLVREARPARKPTRRPGELTLARSATAVRRSRRMSSMPFGTR